MIALARRMGRDLLAVRGRNWTCVRWGHALRCTSNEGHICVRCGRHWK